MFGLNAFAGKLIGFAVVAAIVGGIILVQHLRINSQARMIAELRLQTVTLQGANKDQKKTIDELTEDAAAFEKRADAAEAARAKAEASANARIKATIKRLTDAATPEDRAPVSPALRSALGSLR